MPFEAIPTRLLLLIYNAKELFDFSHVITIRVMMRSWHSDVNVLSVVSHQYLSRVTSLRAAQYFHTNYQEGQL